MKIDVDDELFTKLANDLKTTPENVVRVFLEHAKDIPHSIRLASVQQDGSLDATLEKLMKHAEPALIFARILQDIVGERDYVIDDGGYDLHAGTFWFEVGFLEGDTGEIDSVHLQFGKDSGQIISASMKDLVIENDAGTFLDQIYDVCYEFVDEDYEVTFEHDWIEKDWLTFTIQIDTTPILDLPKIDDLEKMVKKIKEMFRSQDTRKNLK